MDVSLFDFDLPDELIALRPAIPRDSARMMVVREDGAIEHAIVRDLPDYLHRGDALVLNNSKVIAARLHGRRVGRGDTEPKVEVLLHRRIAPDRFLALARPARKLALGDQVFLGQNLMAQIEATPGEGEIELRFDLRGAPLDAAIALQGEIPLPPYIAGKRRTDSRDATDYQTVFAQYDGSVAAPTAGLHFTPELLARVEVAGVARENVTLHVGAGTFLPVKAEDTSGHHMHAEWASLSAKSAETLNRTHGQGGLIAAVGTTTLRTLESAVGKDNRLHEFTGDTNIFITPGHVFRTADILLTNFHLPRSTLFMLVSAFSGLNTMRDAYEEAICERYRFYSYGDACLLFRKKQ